MHYKVLTNRAKIVIVDYKDTLNRDLQMEIDILKDMLPDCKVVILEYEDTKEKKEELINELKGADAVKTAFVMLDRSILSQCRHLKCISFNSTGFNNVDKDYAKHSGIDIMNVPEYCTNEVADHTIMLMLSLNKNLKAYDDMVMKKHRWTYRLPMESHSLSGQTLGIVGFGKIGRAVAKRAKVFGMKVLVCSNHISKDEQEKYGVEYASMEEIQKNSDIISIHTNLNTGNQKMIDEDFFMALQKHPIFINVSRGNLVDEQELIKALDSGIIRAAGLDVLESESPDMSKNMLCGRDNVIITPHAAFYSEESVRKLHELSTRNIAYYLLGQKEKVYDFVE